MMLRLHLLGPVKITLDKTPVTGFESRKALALLCYLAMNNEAVSREYLASLFWSDKPEKRGRGNLSRVLNNLNALLPETIAADRYTLRFVRREGAWIDADAFNALLQGETPAEWERAAALYRGDFLADLRLRGNSAPEFEIWQAAEQERYRQNAAEQLQLLADYHSKQGNWAAALKFARRLLKLTPWREEAHRQVMTLLARTGEFSAALSQYQSCRRTLQKELNVTPAPETESLYRRILSARSAPPPDLPAFPTPFVGRKDDLAQITRCLLQTDCRLLTLLGLGGSGKTRLAAEAAKKQRHVFLDGVFFVSLAAVSAKDALCVTLAEALDLSLRAQKTPQSQLIDFLRPKELLLILDNFEDLLPQAPLLAEILRAAPKVKLLVTSRRPLNLRWETRFTVRGLAYPSIDNVPPGAYGAVQLFAQNARRVTPDFQLTAQNRAAVARLCRQVEGHPLALELASAWTVRFSCREISARIAQNLDLLASAMPDTPPRQQSIQAVLAYSQQLLTPLAQTMLLKLSLFKGEFDKTAAREIGGATEALLAEPGDKFLLNKVAGNRYQMHPLVRRFARRQLREEAALETQVRQARARFFADFLWQRRKAGSSRRFMREISAAWPDIFAAWQRAVKNRNARFIARSAEAISDFLSVRGRAQEGVEMMAQAVEGLGAAESPAAQLALGRARVQQGVLLGDLGFFLESLPHFEAGFALFEALQSKEDMAFTRVWQGNALQDLARYNEAETLGKQGLALYQGLGDVWGIAFANKTLGHIAYNSGNLKAAKHHYTHSARLFEEINDQEQLSAMLINLGNIAFKAEDFAEAEVSYAKSLELKKTLDDRRGIVVAYHNLALVALERKKHAQAQDLITQSLKLSEKINARPRTAASLNLLGDIALVQRDFTAAKSAYRQSLSISREGQNEPMIAESLKKLAELAEERGRSAGAKTTSGK